MTPNFCFYDILKNDKYGRYAVASKYFAPGDLIISEPPFTYGPKSDSPPICLGCHSGIDGQTVCSMCGWPVCDSTCEKLSIHAENECSIFKQAKIKFTPVENLHISCPQYECIMPLRVLLAKERNPEVWEENLQFLESHKDQRKKTEIWAVETVNIVGFLHKVCKLQSRFSEDLIHFVCGLLDINSFIAPICYGYEIRCLYLKTSLLAHSCVPNVGHYIFSETEDSVNHQIYVRAMTEIEKGQELVLSYTQTLAPTLFRRHHLREGKFFNCTCSRCADPSELKTNLSTLKCTNCDKGRVLSTNSLDETAWWKCTHCEFTIEGESVMKMFRLIQKEIDKIDSENSDPVVCREAFLQKYSSVLHPNHAFIMTVKSSLTQLYGKAKGYSLYDLPDNLLERKIKFCLKINEISNKIKPGLSRQRGWNLYELHAPLVLISKNQMDRNEIDAKELKRKLQTAAKYLEEVILIFSYEDPKSPEKFVEKLAIKSLEKLKCDINNIS